MKSDEISTIPVTLKWSKRVFVDQLYISPGSTNVASFREQVYKLTGVPEGRQKLLCKGAWKSLLRDDDDEVFHNVGMQNYSKPLVVTLIGSADVLPEPPSTKTRFLEDLTSEELAEARTLEEQAAWEDAEGMIVALQKPPTDRDDNKTEEYQYNRLVRGLPQRQIEDLLRRRKNTASSFLGEIVMSMGLELRRAYINALSVLSDGTLISGLDDGHVQMWRHGELQKDAIHDGNKDIGGVDCMVSLQNRIDEDDELAFVTGGRGYVRLWTKKRDCVLSFLSPPGSSPASMAAINMMTDPSQPKSVVCLASSFRITRQTNPNQFRLVPQDEQGRQRRAEAEAHEAVVQESLSRISRSIQIWFSSGDSFHSLVLEPDDMVDSAAVTKLAFLANKDDVPTKTATLICGDELGGLRVWRGEMMADKKVHWEQSDFLQLVHTQQPPTTRDPVLSIACLEPLPNGLLAVSTANDNALHAITTGRQNFSLSGSTPINTPTPQAVFVMDIERRAINVVINAHIDKVICMTALPNGGLVTGGGKMDATVKVWESSDLQKNKGSEGDAPKMLSSSDGTKLEN
eukprot:scaffold14749_cov39-Attheya_sp.AAC.3